MYLHYLQLGRDFAPRSQFCKKLPNNCPNTSICSSPVLLGQLFTPRYTPFVRKQDERRKPLCSMQVTRGSERGQSFKQIMETQSLDSWVMFPWGS